MISLAQIRDYCRKQLQEDRKLRSIRVEGESLEEALRQASIELACPLKKIAYELVEKGFKGSFGVGKRPWVILAYPTPEEEKAPEAVGADFGDLGFGSMAEAAANRPGEVFVRLSQEGAFLKVTKPVGSAARSTERMALEKLARRGIERFDAALVAKVVKQADGEYIRVGEYEYDPRNQSICSVEIADQDMKAYMTISTPGPGGPDLSYDEIQSILRANGILHGVKDEVIQNFVDFPRYDEKILAAEGTVPRNGEDAKVVYNFNVDHSKINLREKDGKVDFRELNLVENVEAGQLLAKKIPPEAGQPGSTVLSKIIPVKPGKDVEIGIGKNVKLGDDGATAIATINGQVLLAAGKINVEPIYTVSGDVNFKTGNILFLGTVVVKGNVEDGFSVKAAGNIEVLGSVGKCELDAEGEIVVHQGIMGKNSGRVRSGSNVAAKFIEHAHVEAADNILVSDGIIHSFVDANKRILCSGKRAVIVGGRCRAAEEINAKSLGSVAGTETILEVGIDPKKKERLTFCLTQKESIQRELEEVERNLSTIENLRKVMKKLPEEKAKNLDELNEKRSQMLASLEELNKEIESINTYLSTLKIKGKVSASDRIFPGVKIFVKTESYIIRTELKKVTFYLEGKEIKATKYEPIDEDTARRM